VAKNTRVEATSDPVGLTEQALAMAEQAYRFQPSSYTYRAMRAIQLLLSALRRGERAVY
jgi:hypothetical protein